MELSYGHGTPTETGTFPVGPTAFGHMAGAYSQFSLAVKQDISGKLSIGVIWDQPHGAAVSLLTSAAPSPLAGYHDDRRQPGGYSF